MKRFCQLGICLLILSNSTCLNAQDPQGKLSMAEDFLFGKLQNGMSYFIKDSKTPPGKLYLRLLIKTGFLQEKPEYLELAHVLEHLAFKSTIHFPKGIKDEQLLEDLEMSYRDRGGNTGSHYTRYRFNIASSNQKAFDTGLLWFKDIACGLKLHSSDIDMERGAVIQEFIYSNEGNFAQTHAEKNVDEKLFPGWFSYDRFFEHIKNFPAKDLRSFYDQYYRPELMAVVVVGDIKNIKTVEEKVKAVFNNIPPSRKTKKIVDWDSLYFELPHQFVVEELKGENRIPESDKIKMQFFFRQPELAKEISSPEGYKNYYAFQLFLDIAQGRFKSLEPSYNKRFNSIIKNPYKYEGKPLSYSLEIETDISNSKKAVKQSLQVLHQLKAHGLLEKEWQLAKKNYLNSMPGENTSYWLKEIKNYFTLGEVLDIEKSQQIKNWLNELSLDEFNALIEKFISVMPEDIAIIGSEPGVSSFSEQQLRSWISESFSSPVNKFQFPEVITELIPKEELSKMEKSTYKELDRTSLGFSEIQLANGVTVVFKPFKPTVGIFDDQLMMHGFSTTGASNFPKKDYYSALNAPGLMSYMGIEKFTAEQVKSFMDHWKIIGFDTYIDYKESGIKGVSHLESFERLLQLVYMYYKYPKLHRDSFSSWREHTKALYKKENNHFVNQDYYDEIRHFKKDSSIPPLFGYRHLKGTEAFKSVEQTDSKKAFSIYQKIFGNPQHFTFIITGNYQIEKIMPLVQKYLGNLPKNLEHICTRSPAHSNKLDVGPLFQKIETNAYSIENTKYTLSYIKKSPQKEEWKETIKVELLGELANILIKRLRYDYGFSLYNFGAYGRFNKDASRHRIDFDFNCEASELKAIKNESQKVIQELKEGIIDAKYFNQALKLIKSKYSKENLYQHRNFHNRMYEKYRYQYPWVVSHAYKDYISSITKRDMQQLAEKYFADQNKYEFLMGN